MIRTINASFHWPEKSIHERTYCIHGALGCFHENPPLVDIRLIDQLDRHALWRGLGDFRQLLRMSARIDRCYRRCGPYFANALVAACHDATDVGMTPRDG